MIVNSPLEPVTEQATFPPTKMKKVTDASADISTLGASQFNRLSTFSPFMHVAPSAEHCPHSITSRDTAPEEPVIIWQ